MATTGKGATGERRNRLRQALWPKSGRQTLQNVIVFAIVAVIAPVIVGVHMNGNATVGVIERINDWGSKLRSATARRGSQRSAFHVRMAIPHPGESLERFDHAHGGVPVHVHGQGCDHGHGHDQGHDHAL